MKTQEQIAHKHSKVHDYFILVFILHGLYTSHLTGASHSHALSHDSPVQFRRSSTEKITRENT